LFDLAVSKSVTVAEMFQSGWEVGGEAWVWRRPLRAWEEEMLGSVRLYFLLFHCRLISQINGFGNRIWMVDIRFEVHTRY
jgi:hypothetical protein